MADFHCSLCPESFHTSEEMRVHKGLVHYLSFTCLFCHSESYFGKKGGFVEHLKRNHSNKYQSDKTQMDSHIAAIAKILKKMQ